MRYLLMQLTVLIIPGDVELISYINIFLFIIFFFDLLSLIYIFSFGANGYTKRKAEPSCWDQICSIRLHRCAQDRHILDRQWIPCVPKTSPRTSRVCPPVPSREEQWCSCCPCVRTKIEQHPASSAAFGDEASSQAADCSWNCWASSRATSRALSQYKERLSQVWGFSCLR